MGRMLDKALLPPGGRSGFEILTLYGVPSYCRLSWGCDSEWVNFDESEIRRGCGDCNCNDDQGGEG
jgi:hypothetical protein